MATSITTRIYYLSQLINKPVFDPQKRPVGLIGDFVVKLGGPFPPVMGVTLRLGGFGKGIGPRATFLHWNLVESVDANGLYLSSTRLDLRTFRRREGELLTRADLLDQQVMDIHGRKLVRVNDVQMVAAGHGGADLRLAGISVGFRGLVRRLDLDNLANWVAEHSRLQLADRVIPWDSIEPVDLTELSAENGGGDHPERLSGIAEGSTGGAYGLQLTHEKLSGLHPADVADLVEQLAAPERAALLESLEAEQAAETLGELDPDMQGNVLEYLPTEAAVEILAELPPDEAANALAEVSVQRANELLRGLDAADAEAVRQLMAFPEDVAGGMMTTDYVALAGEQTAQGTIETLRRLAPPAEEIYYVYVINDEGILLGVLSLRDLIVSPPETKIGDIVGDQGEVVSVPVDMEEEEVIRIIAKYNLLAVPVTDEDKRLVGVITVDDALAAALPEETRWSPRSHR